jgi:integrase
MCERGLWLGPVFCHVDKRTGAIVRRAMSGDSIAVTVKAAVKAAGLDPARYSGHSLRAGMATAAAENGASDRAIMARTGHKSSEMVTRYVRHGNLFSVDPLRGVL